MPGYAVLFACPTMNRPHERDRDAAGAITVPAARTAASVHEMIVTGRMAGVVPVVPRGRNTPVAGAARPGAGSAQHSRSTMRATRVCLWTCAPEPGRVSQTVQLDFTTIPKVPPPTSL